MPNLEPNPASVEPDTRIVEPNFQHVEPNQYWFGGLSEPDLASVKPDTITKGTPRWALLGSIVLGSSIGHACTSRVKNIPNRGA